MTHFFLLRQKEPPISITCREQITVEQSPNYGAIRTDVSMPLIIEDALSREKFSTVLEYLEKIMNNSSLKFNNLYYLNNEQNV